MMNKQNNILILENDPTIPDELAHYIDSQNIDDPTIINDLKQKDKRELITAVGNHDIIIIQSTFTDEEQIKEILGLTSIYTDKEYRLLATGERLHYIIHELGRDYHSEFKRSFKDNIIKEICYQRKLDNKGSSHFFKSFLFFFDEIELYYNKERDAFFPERPQCFFENELQPVYKYKPKWELRSWVFESDETY